MWIIPTHPQQKKKVSHNKRNKESVREVWKFESTADKDWTSSQQLGDQ